MNLYDSIVEALQTVYELGLVYEIKIDGGKVDIVMTLTAPACPAAGEIIFDVQSKIEAIEGVTDVHVQLTFDPPWSKDMMSEEAKLELGFL
jgi:metal-sulfur cluster biosynthetic enzyme